MPIEIKELHIRVAINAPQAGQQPSARMESAGSRAGEDTRDAVIAECVEQVLQIIQTRAER